MQAILVISTLLGGLSALWFLYDKAASIYRGTKAREQVSDRNQADHPRVNEPPPPARFVINGVYNSITLEITDSGSPGRVKIVGQYGKPVYQIQAETPTQIVFHGCYNTVWLPQDFRGPLQIVDNGPGNNVRRRILPCWIGRLFGA